MRTMNCFLSIIWAAAALSAASASAAGAASACPAKDFKGFLATFMDSAAVQRAHVSVPLSSTTVDPDAQPEPAPIERKLAAGDIRYPLMPGKARRATDGLRTTIKTVSAIDTEVKLAQDDTGYQMRYLFRKTASCWMLTKISDDSL
jgi:hypothetical protein